MLAHGRFRAAPRWICLMTGQLITSSLIMEASANDAAILSLFQRRESRVIICRQFETYSSRLNLSRHMRPPTSRYVHPSEDVTCWQPSPYKIGHNRNLPGLKGVAPRPANYTETKEKLVRHDPGSNRQPSGGKTVHSTCNTHPFSSTR